MENQPTPQTPPAEPTPVIAPVKVKKAAADPYVGKILDSRFAIQSIVGRGSTSTVYKATDLSNDNCIVAIKMLHAHLAFDDGLVARFEREAQAAKILSHYNVAQISECAITDSGTPYLVEEFIDGVSLAHVLESANHLPAREAAAIFVQLCAGLVAAHQLGIVHRDLKPANIMIINREGKEPHVKILDFGCAKLLVELGDTVLRKTQTGEMLGSLLYMSPEQCLDGEVDGRSDIYALGCVLYETLTGKPPLAARTAFETMNKQLSTMPESLRHVRPDLAFNKNLESMIFKAMAKAPDRRYQKITELMDDLIAIKDDPDVPLRASVNAPSKIIAPASPTAKTTPFATEKIWRYGFWTYCICGTVATINQLVTNTPGSPFSILLYLIATAGFLAVASGLMINIDKQKSGTGPLSVGPQNFSGDLNGKQKPSEWHINHELYVQLGYTKAFTHNPILVFGGRVMDNDRIQIKAGWPNRPDAFFNITPVKKDDNFWQDLCVHYPVTDKLSTTPAYIGATVYLPDSNPVQSLKEPVGNTYIYVESHLARISEP